MAKNTIFYEKSKYIATKFHYIRELVAKGIIELIHIPIREQKADGLTKALGRIKFKEFVNYISLKTII